MNESRIVAENRKARVVLVLILLVAWYVLTMGWATKNSSWEHHPFGGVFILLKESRLLSEEFAVSVAIAVSLIVTSSFWILRGSVWAAVAALIISGVSILLSYGAAASASV